MTDSIDRSIVFAASRYGKGQGEDYLNCPLNEEQYNLFIDALAVCVLLGLWCGMIYLALEPYVRRAWPGTTRIGGFNSDILIEFSI